MPTEILSLGLPQDTLKVISNNLCAKVHAARDLENINELVDSLDVCCIILSADKCPQLLKDVTRLLGHTPLTTKIILLCDPDQRSDLTKLASMGIKTLVAPYDVDDLVDKLVH